MRSCPEHQVPAGPLARVGEPWRPGEDAEIGGPGCGAIECGVSVAPTELPKVCRQAQPRASQLPEQRSSCNKFKLVWQKILNFLKGSEGRSLLGA